LYVQMSRRPPPGTFMLGVDGVEPKGMVEPQGVGLRLGDALSMKLEEGGKASFRVKGGRTRVLTLPEEVRKQFKSGPKRPFADWKLQSTGAAIAMLGVDGVRFPGMVWGAHRGSAWKTGARG